MKGNYTLTMIKPQAVKNQNIGNILALINNGGFRITAMKMLVLSNAQAKAFYAIHKERPFYGELVEFMTSGPIIAAVLEKDNAVLDYRKLMGATNPADADEGTIRKQYASNIQNNAVHGSDSDENAKNEINFFFATNNLYTSCGELVEEF